MAVSCMSTAIAGCMSPLAATRRLKRYFLFFMVTVYWGLEIRGRQLPRLASCACFYSTSIGVVMVRTSGSVIGHYIFYSISLFRDSCTLGSPGSPLDYLSVKASSFSHQSYRQRKSKRLTRIKVHRQLFSNIIIIIINVLTNFDL